MQPAPPPGLRFIKRLALLAGGLFALTAAMAQPGVERIAPSASSSPSSAQAVALPELARALRQGGYVIYFRHTATDFSKTDAGMRDYADCGNQRMLSSEGRNQARDIGRHIAALKLPPVQVLASPMCRTLETAQLMFGRATPNNTLREGAAGDYPGLKQLLAGPVAASSNRWLVGHGTPFRTIAGPPHLAEGEAAVIRPEGKSWSVVARVLPQEWAQLK